MIVLLFLLAQTSQLVVGTEPRLDFLGLFSRRPETFKFIVTPRVAVF
jgi:hypothetical protein